jgi:hypothetical protein
MSYQTVEVELESGRVHPRGTETLPERAHALLTILAPGFAATPARGGGASAGLGRFLSKPDFPLTPEQFRASMEADGFEQ